MEFLISPTKTPPPPRKDLLGSDAFNTSQEMYSRSFTSIDIFEDIVDVRDIEKVMLSEI